MGASKTSDHIYIKVKMTNPSQEPPAPTKAPNQDLEEMYVLCIFKMMIESTNSEYGCTKDKQPYPNQDKDAKPQSETFSLLQSPKSGFKELDLLCTVKIQINYQNLEHGYYKDK